MRIPISPLVLFLSVFLSFSVNGQQGDANIYFHSTYRAVSAENNAAFQDFISEIIKPMFVEEVENGRLTGWYIWRAHYVSDQESYNYIFSRATTDLASIEQAFDGGFESAVNRVHGDVLDEVNARSAGLSRVVKNELWVQSPISVLRGAGEPARWANVVFYQNNNLRDTARDLLLQNVIAQWQLARMDRGVSDGWAYFTRRFPFDGRDSYDVAEFWYYDSFEEILGAGIGREIWADIRTDESELWDNQDRLEGTRSYIKRELWELIDYVQQ